MNPAARSPRVSVVASSVARRLNARLIGAILLDVNNEWVAQDGHYMTLTNIDDLSVDHVPLRAAVVSRPLCKVLPRSARTLRLLHHVPEHGRVPCSILLIPVALSGGVM